MSGKCRSITGSRPGRQAGRLLAKGSCCFCSSSLVIDQFLVEELRLRVLPGQLSRVDCERLRAAMTDLLRHAYYYHSNHHHQDSSNPSRADGQRQQQSPPPLPRSSSLVLL